MEGFEAGVGRPYYTIPLAADHTVLFRKLRSVFKPTFLYWDVFAGEAGVFQKCFSAQEKNTTCGLRTGLTPWIASWASFNGRQYFNIPILRSLQKPNWRWKMSGESIRPRPFRSMFMNLPADIQRLQ